MQVIIPNSLAQLTAKSLPYFSTYAPVDCMPHYPLYGVGSSNGGDLALGGGAVDDGVSQYLHIPTPAPPPRGILVGIWSSNTPRRVKHRHSAIVKPLYAPPNPVQGVVWHTIDRCIMGTQKRTYQHRGFRLIAQSR